MKARTVAQSVAEERARLKAKEQQHGMTYAEAQTAAVNGDTRWEVCDVLWHGRVIELLTGEPVQP